MRLLVARHGATRYNLEARFTGQIDAPLSALGQRQAEALANRLAGERPLPDLIVASNLIRAQATAEAFARRLDQPVTLDPDLREISMGAWEGRPVAEVAREQPDLFARVETDPMGEASAPGGESWAAFSDRVHCALDRWRGRAPSGGTVFWVTHGGVISALLLRALGLSFERRAQFRRGNTGLFEFEYTTRWAVLVRANDTAHLDALGEAAEGERAQVL